jgi:hypothetical protein
MTLRSKTTKKKTGATRRRQQPSTPVVKPPRAIPAKTSLFLHVRAGGRCEFDNCNAYLLEHEPTSSPGLYSERAHIWAFSEKGPRGSGRRRPRDIHHIDNLMLLCKDCHTKIDNEPEIYSVAVLRKFKRDHEVRIFGLTGLAKDRDTVPLVLKGLIGSRIMDISDDDMQGAVAPNCLRLREKVEIDLTALPDSADPNYWASGRSAIDARLQQLSVIRPRGNRSLHVSVFALAAIPLLAYLGSKLSDKIRVDLYQRHRNPESWNWHDGSGNTCFDYRKTKDGRDRVGLIVNVSGTIPPSAIDAITGDMTLYELGVTGQPPTPLVLNTRDDLNRFVVAYVKTLEAIRATHPGLRELHVFPAVPAPIAITLGRHTLPKVGPALIIYDQDRRSTNLSPAITLGSLDSITPS